MQITLSGQLAALHAFVLETFASTGRAPAPEHIQRRFSLDAAAAEALVAELEASGAVHRAPGDARVTHAYPFSDAPTAHRVRLASGVAVHAMCAVDALGIPFMLRTDAQVESRCAHCGAPVRVAVAGGRLVGHAPDGLVVGYLPQDGCTVPATQQCPHVNFFCDGDHLDALARAHPGQALRPLALKQALARGREVFEPLADGATELRCP